MPQRINGPARPPATRPTETTAKPAEPKKLTSADVVQSRELAGKYVLDTGNLPFRTSEEIVEYIQYNLDAVSGKRAPSASVREHVEHSLHFAIAELEDRVPYGPLRQQLYDARQAVIENGNLSKADIKQAKEAVAAFVKHSQIDKASAKWDPAVFEPAAQVNRFRYTVDSFTHNLGRVYMPGYDSGPDFRKDIQNPFEFINPELAKVVVPTGDKEKLVFARAVDEVAAQIGRLVSVAEDVERPDIAASGKEALALLAKYREAVS